MFHMMRNLITSQVQEMTIGIRTDISAVTHDLYCKMHELDKAYGKLPASYIPRELGQAQGSTAHEYNIRAGTDKKRTFSIRDLSKPEKYTGSDDPEDFIATLTRMYNLTGVDTDEERVGYAATCLSGPARTWINTVTSAAMPPEQRESVATWEGFKEELIEQFTPVNKGKVARDQLACTKQEESEPVRKYVQRMREIFLKIPSITEDEKLDRFVRNLRLVIREKVDMHNPRTFDEAASRAERIDATWNQTRKAHADERHMGGGGGGGRNRDRHRDRHGNNRTPMDIGATRMSPRRDRQAPYLTPHQKELKAQGKCTKCGKAGWTPSHKCESKEADPLRRRDQTPPPGNGSWRQPYNK